MGRQLAESLVLALTAGSLALMLTLLILQAVVPLIPVYVPRIYDVGIDWRVLLFAVAASVLTATAAGLLPAWKSGRTSVNDMLKQGGLGANVTPTARLHAVLIAGEIALHLLEKNLKPWAQTVNRKPKVSICRDWEHPNPLNPQWLFS